MKKFTMTLLMGGMLTVLLSATATFAQRQNCDSNGRRDRSYNERGYNNASYQNQARDGRRGRNNDNRSYSDAYYQEQNQSGYYDNGSYYGYDNRSTYQKHRKKINYGVSIGAGAIIGALIGGKKGALIGAGAGVAAGAIITKKTKPKTIYYGY
jgi:hypothetical protein